MDDCVTFGRKLILSGDLDPVYTLLHFGNLPTRQLQGWLVAYWSFYHVGTASWISESPNYWDRFEMAANSKDYPRCHERRHFRGLNAAKSTAYLKSRGLEDLWRDLLSLRKNSCEEVMEKVQRWVGFGPWIAFKVADMLERLGLVRINFDPKTVFLFDSPKEGAERLWASVGKPIEGTFGIGSWATNYLLNELGDLDAPPSFDRKVGVQEMETILCKHKAYENRKYHIGEDIASCRKGLLKFSRCRTSQKLIKAGTKGGLW